MRHVSDLTARDIQEGLQRLGIRAGETLVVHSSLSRFGQVAGGAEAVAQALIDAVSPGGSVFVPTFNYGQLPYDILTTPSLAGAISEALRKRPDARRSAHPTHPWAGVGPIAEEVLAGHTGPSPFGPGSPIWKLWERNALLVLLGVDHRANSMIHVAEERLQLAYLARTRIAEVVQGDGTVREVTVGRPGCSAGFNKIDPPLRAEGKLEEGTIGSAPVTLARAHDVVAAAEAMLRSDPAALLCDRVECERCAQAREMLRAMP
jgi:aminoglycoside 3-N-acetyltransferase